MRNLPILSICISSYNAAKHLKECMFLKQKNQPTTMEEMLKSNRLAHPTMMIRTSSLDKIPVYYEEDYIYAEDYKLWMMIYPDILLINDASADGYNYIRTIYNCIINY